MGHGAGRGGRQSKITPPLYIIGGKGGFVCGCRTIVEYHRAHGCYLQSQDSADDDTLRERQLLMRLCTITGLGLLVDDAQRQDRHGANENTVQSQDSADSLTMHNARAMCGIHR